MTSPADLLAAAPAPGAAMAVTMSMTAFDLDHLLRGGSSSDRPWLCWKSESRREERCEQNSESEFAHFRISPLYRLIQVSAVLVRERSMEGTASMPSESQSRRHCGRADFLQKS
jgi:hypothetical protein